MSTPTPIEEEPLFAIHFENQPELKPKDLPASTPVQYPGEFFAQTKARPPVTLPTVIGTDKEILDTLIHSFTSNEACPVILALEYIKRFYPKIKGTLGEDDWESYGIKIGLARQEVNALSPLQVSLTKQETVKLTATKNTASDTVIMYSICCGYRLGLISRPDHRLQVSKIVDAMYGRLGELNLSANSVSVVTAGWVNNDNFRKVMASLDMFLMKFQDHELSYLRVGTIPTRYKDCTSLTSISKLAESTGMSIRDLSEWMWSTALAAEMLQINDGEQEIENMDSYFPYMIEMKISTKSPYSAPANPNIYTWIHIVGSSLRLPRSLNAKLLQNCAIMNVVYNAGVFAYVISQHSNMSLQFATKQKAKDFSNIVELVEESMDLYGTKESEEEEEEQAESGGDDNKKDKEKDAQDKGDPDDEITGGGNADAKEFPAGLTEPFMKDPLVEPSDMEAWKWLVHFYINKNSFSPVMKKVLKKNWTMAGTLREGSIGEYLKNFAQTF